MHCIEGEEIQEIQTENVTAPMVGKNTRKNQVYRKKRKERKILQKFSDASPDFVAKLDLRLPPNGIFDEGKELSQFERELVGKQLQKNTPQVAQIREMFVATEKSLLK